MGTIFASTALRTKAPLALHKPVICDLAKEMSNWEVEINFYHRLLTWSLFSCREEDRYDIEILLARLNNLRSCDLPALKEKLGLLPSGLDLDRTFNRNGQETAALRVRFDHFEQNLQRLKSKIFQAFPPFCRVEIW